MISIGTDIVQISRIKKALETNKNKFLNKIFTEEEIKYCNSHSNPHIHLQPQQNIFYQGSPLVW